MPLPTFDNIKITDEEGMLTEAWRSIFQQLFEVLQARIGDEGIVIPSQSAANISLLTNSPNGTMVYNSDLNVVNIQINGSWKTITTY